jgi:hypothetical protein
LCRRGGSTCRRPVTTFVPAARGFVSTTHTRCVIRLCFFLPAIWASDKRTSQFRGACCGCWRRRRNNLGATFTNGTSPIHVKGTSNPSRFQRIARWAIEAIACLCGRGTRSFVFGGRWWRHCCGGLEATFQVTTTTSTLQVGSAGLRNHWRLAINVFASSYLRRYCCGWRYC